MKITFVVDARSPISINWISYFLNGSNDVHVISTYPCDSRHLLGARVYEVPVALSGFAKGSRRGNKVQRQVRLSALRSSSVRVQSSASEIAQNVILPLRLRHRVTKIRQLIADISPDLIHAMRIPFEGVLAAKATPTNIPLLVSVWGNDFTLWAETNQIIARQTRQTLRRADALLCDCKRDLELACRDWGFDGCKPLAVLPGAGGIQSSIFHPREANAELKEKLGVSDNVSVIFNPRGFRSYV